MGARVLVHGRDRARGEGVVADIKAAGALDPSLSVDFERHREFVDSGKFSEEFHQNFLILQELRGVMPVIEMLGRRTWSLLAYGCAHGRRYASDITRRTVGRFNLALLRFSTGRVFGPHERYEFGSSNPELPLVVGSDVLDIVGDFVWYDDDPSESEETATARTP